MPLTSVFTIFTLNQSFIIPSRSSSSSASTSVAFLLTMTIGTTKNY